MLETPRLLTLMTTLRTSTCKGTFWNLATALVLGSLASPLCGEPVDLLKNPSAVFHSLARDPLPTSALPAQVQAVDGKLTLWADYASADQSSVPLYLVNRTAGAISLSTQDSDLGIKLEFKNEGGAWTRAQAHLASWCGNSYYPVKLPAGHFFKLQGYRAANGGKHPVRYTLHRDLQLSSNTGEGPVSPEDISAVESDSITKAKIPYPIYHLIESCFRDDRSAGALAECISVLRILPRLERNQPLLDSVQAFHDFLTIAPATRENQEALQAVKKVLQHQWSSDPAAVVPITQLCMQRILETSGAPPEVSGLPEHLAWQVLSAPPGRNSMPTPEDLPAWKPVLARAEQVIRDPGTAPVVKNSARNILSRRMLVEPLVPDATVIEWLKSPHRELQAPGAQALLTRGQRQKLVQIAWDLDPGAQMSVLSTLAQADWLVLAPEEEASPPTSSEEKRFWTHCFTTQPLESVQATLFKASVKGEAVRVPLREFLTQEAKRGMASEKEFPLDKLQAEMLPYAVRLLDEFHQAEDDALLRDLAKHRGTIAQHDPFSSATSTLPVVANTASLSLKERAQSRQGAKP